MTLKTITINATSLLLAAAVLLSGAHARDVLKTSAHKSRDVAKVHVGDDGGGTPKVSSELHNHIDKQTLKTLYHNGDIQQRADRRSIQLLEDEARSYSAELKLGAALWFKLVAAKLML